LTGVCALIPAAGRGARFGSPENKVFADLLGRPLLGWTLEAFANCTAVDHVFLVGGVGDENRLRAIGETFGGGKVRDVFQGGADRQASVAAGLRQTANAEFVLVHDAARPCVTPELVAQVAQAARIFGAATAAVAVSDTLVRSSGANGEFARETVSRDHLWAVQTPQGFRRELLLRAHRRAEETNAPRGTDDAGLVQTLVGEPVRLLPGSPENLKVTRAEDLALAEAVLARREQKLAVPTLRVGHGYDVHPFTDGRPLVLGGVLFPDEARGLLGHSDADVVLHAVCDALLGAAGLGDIGKFFPPSDAAHKDRASSEFLREVFARLDAAGWRVANVDVTILAEAPKIGPRADAMKQGIARALQITPEQVGVKATTNEGMGFVGRGEGIAAHATALIFR